MPIVGSSDRNKTLLTYYYPGHIYILDEAYTRLHIECQNNTIHIRKISCSNVTDCQKCIID